MTSKAYKTGWWLLMIFNLVGLLNSLLILVQIILAYMAFIALTSPLAELWISNSGLIIFPFLISLVVFASIYFTIKSRFAEKKYILLSLVFSLISTSLITIFDISFNNSINSLPLQLNVFTYILLVIFVVSIILILLGLRTSSGEMATLGKKSKLFLIIFCIFPLIVAIASTVFCFYDLLTNDYGYGSIQARVGKPILIYDLTKRAQGQVITSLIMKEDSNSKKVFQTIGNKLGSDSVIITQVYSLSIDVDSEIQTLLGEYQYNEIYLIKLGKKAYLTVPTMENKNEIIIFNNNGVQVMIISQNPLDETSANQLMDKLIEK